MIFGVILMYLLGVYNFMVCLRFSCSGLVSVLMIFVVDECMLVSFFFWVILMLRFFGWGLILMIMFL